MLEPDEIGAGVAARLLGVHVKTIKRWAHDGAVPAWQTPGGHWRFSRAELAVWREARKPEAAAS